MAYHIKAYSFFYLVMHVVLTFMSSLGTGPCWLLYYKYNIIIVLIIELKQFMRGGGGHVLSQMT